MSLEDLVNQVSTVLGQVSAILGQLLGWMEVGRWAANVAVDWLVHFCWSSLAGYLAYTLTYSLTVWACGSLVFRGRSRISWQGVLEPVISRFCMFSLLAGSWLAHLWYDGLIG